MMVWSVRAHHEHILAEHLSQGQQHRADPNGDEGHLLEEDPVAVPLNKRQVCQEAGDEPAQAGAHTDAHDELCGLLAVLLVVLVQRDLLGKLGQVTVGHEISEESERNGESPDYKSLVPPVRKVDKTLHNPL